LRAKLIKNQLFNVVYGTAWNNLLDEWGVEALMFKQGINSTLFSCPILENMATHEAPHIGHLIREELARQERTVVWFARKLNYSRQNVYYIFESSWITTDVLLRICDILNHNFFKDYSDFWESRQN